MSDHSKFLSLAINEAKTAVTSNDGMPYGAVVVDKYGDVIATGHNTSIVDHDPTAHGEVTAIRAACRKMKSQILPAGCTLYSSCQPCPMCLAACLWANITSIYYAASMTESASYELHYGDILHFVKTHEPKSYAKLEQIPVESRLGPFDLYKQKCEASGEPMDFRK